MTKKQDKPEEGAPLAEKADTAPAYNEWDQVVMAWADKSNVPVVAARLKAELAQTGIFTVEELATAPVKVLAGVARAAIQADAQALQAAAYRVLRGGNS